MVRNRSTICMYVCDVSGEMKSETATFQRGSGEPQSASCSVLCGSTVWSV